MDNSYKEVYFNKHCKTCKYYNVTETKDPCNDCLEYPVNYETEKPMRWKEKKK